jgi:hypothetical protein
VILGVVFCRYAGPLRGAYQFDLQSCYVGLGDASWSNTQFATRGEAIAPPPIRRLCILKTLSAWELRHWGIIG